MTPGRELHSKDPDIAGKLPVGFFKHVYPVEIGNDFCGVTPIIDEL
jgi:hypothetical protein